MWKSWDSMSALFLRMNVIPNDSLVLALPTHVNQAIIWNDSLNTFNSPNQSLANHLPLTRFSHIKSFCHFVLFSMLTNHIPKLIHPNPLTTQTLSLIHLNSHQTHSLHNLIQSHIRSTINWHIHSFLRPNSFSQIHKLTHPNSHSPLTVPTEPTNTQPNYM